MMKLDTKSFGADLSCGKNFVRTIKDRFCFVILKYHLSQMIRTLSEYVY